MSHSVYDEKFRSADMGDKTDFLRPVHDYRFFDCRLRYYATHVYGDTFAITYVNEPETLDVFMLLAHYLSCMNAKGVYAISHTYNLSEALLKLSRLFA